MGSLTKNFSRGEFACQCGCGFDTVDHELVSVMQRACDYFSDKLKLDRVVAKVTSGCRCETHNFNEGGEEGSYHTKGQAADFRIRHVTAEELYYYLDECYPNKYGVGFYRGSYLGRVHLDVQSKRKRWGL